MTGTTSGELPCGLGQKIFVVDDEVALTKMLEKLLRRLNHQVTTSNSAIEAAEFFRADSAQFNLIITDLTMPDMNGLDLARQLRVFHPDLPVILVSGLNTILNDDNLREAGICELLDKPLSLARLADTLHRILHNGQARVAPIVSGAQPLIQLACDSGQSHLQPCHPQ